MAGKTIAVMLQAVTGPYQAAMKRAAVATQGFSAAARGAGQQVGNVATSTGMMNAKLLGGAGLAFGIKSVADSAIRWESAFAGVRKTVDGTEAELSALSDGLLDMSTRMPIAAEELAGIAEAAGQLGVSTENIEGFTEVMGQLSATTNLGSEEAATSLARLANIMGTSQDDFDRLGSSLVFLGNNFATTEREILELGTRMAAAGRIAGLTEGDLFGFATALSSVGVEAEAGGTAMSKVFTAINDAVRDGGDKLVTFADTAGMSVSRFRTAFEDDAAGAIAAFVAGLGRVNEAGGSTTAIFEELELTDQRLMRALLSTSSAGDMLTDAIEDGNQAFEDGTAAQEEYAKRLDTTEAKIQTAMNSIENLKRAAGGVILPDVGRVAGGLTDILNPGNLVDEFRERVSDPLNPAEAFREFMDRAPLPVAPWIRDLVDGADDAAESTRTLNDMWAATQDNVGDFLAGAGGRLVGWLREGAQGAQDVAGAQQDMSAWVEDANGNLEHQIELFRQTTADPVTNLVDALDAVEEAQTAYTEAVQEYGRGSDEAAEAGLQLFRSVMDAQVAADTASGKFGGVEAALYGMRDAGLLTAEQVETIIGLLGDARREAGGYEGTYMATLDVDIDPVVRKLRDLRESGFHVAIPGTFEGGIAMHTGGIVAGNAGAMPGLAPDERLRVLQVGERVVSAQAAGAFGAPSQAGTTIGRQVVNGEGAIQLVVRDEQAGMRAAHRELKMMELGYV